MNPFEQFTSGSPAQPPVATAAPAPGVNPFEQFTAGTSAPSPTPMSIGPEISTYEDVKRTLPAAAQRGVIGLPGFAGNLQGLVRGGMDWLLPPTEKQLAARAEADKFNLLPSSRSLIKAAEPVTGNLYEPQTATGKIVGAGVEALPTAAIPGGQAGAGARLLSAAGSGAGGEAAGLAAEGTVLETPARILGSIAGGVAAPKSVTPYTNRNDPTRAGQVQLLESSGVPLTAGQRLGNPALQSLEAKAATRTGGIGAGERLNQQQAEEFSRAVTDRAVPRSGPNQVIGNAPDPQVLNAAQNTLSNEYNRIFRNREMQYDHALGVAMDNAVRKAGGSLPTANAADIKKLSNVRADIADAVVNNQGKISGQQYQNFRSDLTTMARDAYRTGNSNLADGAKAMRNALDDKFAQTLPPQLAADLKLNNQRYANLKSVTSASAKSGGENITPQNLIAAQKTGRAAQFAKQTQPLDELAAAGRDVMKPLPKAKDELLSTAGRALRYLLPGGGAGTAVGMVAGPVAGAAAGLAGSGASILKNRAVLSRAGQRYLGNQVAPIAAREAVARALLEQAIRGR